MADLKVTQLSNLGAMPATNDLIMVVDVSDTSMSAGGTNKKVTANYLGRSSGAVVYAQDGKALTLPASGTAATLQAANTFEAEQTVAPTATGTLLTLTPPTNNGNVSVLYLSPFDNGASVGVRLTVGENNNATTPAAGCINLRTKAGGNRYIWHDSSGLLRSGTVVPTSVTDTGSSVVGDQTSMLEAKALAADDVAPLDQVLKRIEQGAAAVRRWSYKDGAYNGEEFEGVVTDFAPAYGKDRDKEHPNGKALNNIVILGDLLRAAANLAQRVLLLEGIALDSATPEGSLTQAQREALASLGGSLLARYGS